MLFLPFTLKSQLEFHEIPWNPMNSPLITMNSPLITKTQRNIPGQVSESHKIAAPGGIARCLKTPLKNADLDGFHRIE